VIVAGVVMLMTGWYYADPLISAGIGLFILPRTWMLMRDAVGVLLEGTPSDVNIASVRKGVEGVPGVAGVHDLHVWSLTSGVNAMSVHAVLAAGASHDEVLAAVQRHVIANFKISHVTVQVESEGCAQWETHL
jgi:cobalt-zinc-cadmium efflux system protein